MVENVDIEVKMSKDELRELNLFKAVYRKGKKYAVNGAPFQSIGSLVTFLFKMRSIVVSEGDLKELLDELAISEKVREKTVQEKIQRMFGGEREVKTPVGYVDLVNDEMIVEVKEAKSWKHSFGQIEAYSKFFPNHEKALYLFGECPPNLFECYKLCKESGVRLFCEFC